MTDNICISFSGGRTSAMMCIELLRLPEYENAIVIFANTGKENEETLKFVNQVDQFIGGRIIWLEYDPEIDFKVVTYETASRKWEPFAALIRKRKYTPNRVARFCTSDLKIRPMKRFLQRVIGWEHWTNMVGIRFDEPKRWGKSKTAAERHEVFEVEHPMVKWKTTKPIVLSYWKAMPFDLELEEQDGNCDVCFLKGMKKKQKIARKNPERFDWWIKMEKEIDGTFIPKITYEQIRDYALRTPEFDFEYDEIECFCNID